VKADRGKSEDQFNHVSEGRRR